MNSNIETDGWDIDHIHDKRIVYTHYLFILICAIFVLVSVYVMIKSYLWYKSLSNDRQIESVEHDQYNMIDDVLLKEIVYRHKYTKELILKNCSAIKDYSEIGKLKKLERLSLDRCDNMKDIKFLSELTNLVEIKIGNARYLKMLSINTVSNLIRLERIEIYSCKELVDISALQYLSHVKILKLSNCPKIINVDFIAKMKSIIELRLLCKNITDIVSLSNLTNMIHLRLNSPNIYEIDSLADMIKIETLILYDTSNVANLSSIGTLINLKNLQLYNSSFKYTSNDFKYITNLQQLEVLKIRKFNNLQDINLFYKFIWLKKLNIEYCGNIRSSNHKSINSILNNTLVYIVP